MFTTQNCAMALLLAVGLLTGCGGQGHENAGARADASDAKAPPDKGPRISGPFTHENLSIYLIHGPDKLPGVVYLTLDEAMAQKKVIVHETGNVNQLAIENVSRDDVYVQSGDIVKGGQQDRTIASDFLLSPRSGKVPIAAFCVESGRWQQRGSETLSHFALSSDVVPSKGLKLAVKESGEQGEVWKNVARAQQQLSLNAGETVTAATSPSSLQLTLENKTVQDTTDEYIKKLQPAIDGKDDVIGYAFAINGKVNSADVYASHAFFKKLWPRLIRASAVEAFAELKKGEKCAAPAMADVDRCVSEPTAAPRNKQVNSRTQTATYDQTDSIYFDTRDDANGGALIHRNYINKEPAEATPEKTPQR